MIVSELYSQLQNNNAASGVDEKVDVLCSGAKLTSFSASLEPPSWELVLLTVVVEMGVCGEVVGGWYGGGEYRGVEAHANSGGE